MIEQSSGQSWIGSDRMRRAIAGDLAPRAHTTLLAKDSRLAMEMAAEAGFRGAARTRRCRALPGGLRRRLRRPGRRQPAQLLREAGGQVGSTGASRR